MIKMRLEGLENELHTMIDSLKEKGFEILEVSKPYPNRNSKLVRIYVTVSSIV